MITSGTSARAMRRTTEKVVLAVAGADQGGGVVVGDSMGAVLTTATARPGIDTAGSCEILTGVP